MRKLDTSSLSIATMAVLAAVLATLAACGGGDDPPPPDASLDAGGLDAGADASKHDASDASHDGAAHDAPDATHDGADATVDGAPDATRDAGHDAPIDAPIDAIADALDATDATDAAETSVDATTDGSDTAETGADGVPEAAADATSDGDLPDVVEAGGPLSLPCLLAFGDTNRQRPAGIAADNASNILITGSFDGTIDFGSGAMKRTTGSGSSDVYVAKFDAACHPVFSKQFGNGAEQYGEGIAADAQGNMVLVGTFLGGIDFGGGTLSAGWDDVYVAKLDPAGHHLWSHSYGASATKESGYGVAVDGAGNVALAGQLYEAATVTFGGAPLVGAGGYDVWVAKLDASGNALWGKRFGDAADQRGGDVATDAAGNVFTSGWFQGTMDFGGGPLKAASRAQYAGQDAFVAKLDANGAYVWARRFGDEYDQAIDALAVDPNGDVIVTGTFEGSIDFGLGALTANQGQSFIFVAKLAGSDGHALWSKLFWGGAYQVPNAIAADSSGNVYLTGAFQGALTFGTPLPNAFGSEAAFVVKLDPNGTAIWSKGGGTVSWQVPTGIAVDPLGDAITTGDFSGAMSLGGGPVAAAGTDDIFLSKITPP